MTVSQTAIHPTTGHHSDTVALPALSQRRTIPLRQVEESRPDKFNTTDVDARGLESELRRCIRGEVRFDAGSRALYATDGSNYRQVPLGAVIPSDLDDVIA